MADFKLPDVGEGLTEAEIVSWKVKEGDVVEINDIVVEIETAKSLVELPSPYAGTVPRCWCPRARRSRSGRRSSRSATAPRRRRPLREAAPPRAARDMADRPVQPRRQRWRRGREPGRPQQGRPGPMRRARRGRPRPRPRPVPATQMQVQGAFAPGGAQSEAVVEADEPAVPAPSVVDRASLRTHPGRGALAKPPVRKLAKDLGVDLAKLTGSGPQGVDHPRRRADGSGRLRDARGARSSPRTGLAPRQRAGRDR